MKDRSKRALRAKLAPVIEQLAQNMTHSMSDLSEVFTDLSKSKLWADLCGGQPGSSAVPVEENPFLRTLAKEYHSCTDKEITKQVKHRSEKLSSKVKISGSVQTSRISFDGSTTCAKNRVEAAKAMGRIQKCADARRCTLSIVAQDYPYSTLTHYFQCSRSTVAAARAHAILFGRGGVPKDNLKFTRKCLSDETLTELYEFLNRDEISGPSSCRSVMVNGQETPVRYWQDSVKNIVQQYLLEFPNGVKRS